MQEEHSAPSGLTHMPTRSYPVPPQPLFVQKKEYAVWDIDHTRYECKRQLGRGSYGVVVEAWDHMAKRKVAIKKINDIFGFFENTKRIYRELRILGNLVHPNVVKLLDVSQPGISDPSVDLMNFTDVYVVFEFLDTDLQKLCKDETQCLTEAHVRWFLYQLLVALKATHSARIIHRDIKPANVLLTEGCDVRLCDFGLACTLDQEADDVPSMSGWMTTAAGGGVGGGAVMPGMMEGGGGGGGGAMALDMSGGAAGGGSSGGGGGMGMGGRPSLAPPPKMGSPSRQLTKHVVTRWYRGPELPLYNDGKYTTALDMWSVGCVFAEMLGMLDTGNPDDRYERKALFPGGSCFPLSPKSKGKKDQLACIIDVLGTPSKAIIDRLKSAEAKAMVAEIPVRAPQDFRKKFPTASDSARDLLLRTLEFLPEDRISVDDALKHPFFKGIKRPAVEPPQPEVIHFGAINPENVRALLVEEIRRWNPHIPLDWPEVCRKQRGGVGGGGVSSLYRYATSSGSAMQ